MAADFILLTEDKAVFDPKFGDATVSVLPGHLEGSANTFLGDKKLCLKGDETKVEVRYCPYNTKDFPKHGFGILKIKQLQEEQKAKKFTIDKKPVLLKGKLFEAIFKVTTEAADATGAKDPIKYYDGIGWFETKNQKWTAE